MESSTAAHVSGDGRRHVLLLERFFAVLVIYALSENGMRLSEFEYSLLLTALATGGLAGASSVMPMGTLALGALLAGLITQWLGIQTFFVLAAFINLSLFIPLRNVLTNERLNSVILNHKLLRGSFGKNKTIACQRLPLPECQHDEDITNC